ncbi:MAG: FKBP-type peptidyl-prolyl cis-trans isomerase [Acidobacteriota bacterium]|nr:FKBP-type peptidyl-prolyl cis-trans isomerase [Acidobacteriota bacterium]
MKFITTLLVASLALAQNAAFAQTKAPAKPASHASSATHAAPAGAHGCLKLPDVSPKVPALPAGAPCAKPLFTITTVPSVKLDYVSPEEGSALKDFLGIESTSFSLGYVDTKVGTGELAAPHKYYSIQYTGYLVDGSKFDSSYDHGGDPLTFPVGQHQVVPGWDTGFAGMRVGGKRRLFIPYQLAYGPNGRPPTIPARAELIFDLEFVAQSDKAPAPAPPPFQPQPKSPAAPGSPQPPAAPGSPQPPTAPPSSPPPPADKPQPSAPPATAPPAAAPATTTPPAAAPATATPPADTAPKPQ